MASVTAAARRHCRSRPVPALPRIRPVMTRSVSRRHRYWRSISPPVAAMLAMSRLRASHVRAPEHSVRGQMRGLRNERDAGAGTAHVELAPDCWEYRATRRTAARSKRRRPVLIAPCLAARREASSTGAMPAMRQDDRQELPLKPAPPDAAQIGQAVPHQRPDIGVHDRGRDTLIFLDLRQHVA